LDLNTVTFPAPAQQKASGTGPSKNTTHTKASTPASERKRIRPSKAGDKRGTSRSATPTEKARAAHDASAPMDVIMQDATEEETSRATPEPGLISPVRSKAEEIEALRRGGSMTSRPEEVHRVKNIHCIVLAHHKIETWYFSPYPEEFELQDTIYICEFCLSFFNSRVSFD
jgi:histone acetyltransferase HTATIP